jgi:hypothetical protein
MVTQITVRVDLNKLEMKKKAIQSKKLKNGNQQF